MFSRWIHVETAVSSAVRHRSRWNYAVKSKNHWTFDRHVSFSSFLESRSVRQMGRSRRSGRLLFSIAHRWFAVRDDDRLRSFVQMSRSDSRSCFDFYRCWSLSVEFHHEIFLGKWRIVFLLLVEKSMIEGEDFIAIRNELSSTHCSDHFVLYEIFEVKFSMRNQRTIVLLFRFIRRFQRWQKSADRHRFCSKWNLKSSRMEQIDRFK